MPFVQYAFREDAKTIALLTQGITAECPLCQIVTLRKKPVHTAFLGEFLALDVKKTKYLVSEESTYGRTILPNDKYKHCFAKVDAQYEFSVRIRTMQKLAEFIPAYTPSALYNFFQGQTYGYLVVLKVFLSSQTIPDVLMEKGRLGSSQIISFYDADAEKTNFEVEDDFVPLVEEGDFENIKYEISHSLRLDNALIGVYSNDEESLRLLRERETIDDGSSSKRTYNLEDDVDHSLTNYDEIFARVLELAPSMADFIREVKKIKPPQLGECPYLLDKVKQGDSSAQKRLVEMYLRNVINISLGISEKHELPIEDMIQEGILGLMAAIRKFEGAKNETFQQYFPLWVMQYIQRATPSYVKFTQLPIHAFDKVYALDEKIKDRCLDIETDFICFSDKVVAELAHELDLSASTTRSYLTYLLPPLSIEDIADREESDPIIDDELVEDGERELLAHINQKMLREEIYAVLDTLTPREAQILNMKHGLDDDYPKTLEEIGAYFSLTRERVRQIEAKAIRKMRNPGRSKRLAHYLD